MTPQQATADQATIEVMQHFVANISGLELREKIKQTIIKAMESRAPAPTEPAVDRDAVTVYLRQFSSFGPWIECKADDEGAVKFSTPASPAVPEPAPLAPRRSMSMFATLEDYRAAQASQPTSAEGKDSEPLPYGHRDDWYLMANCRRLLSRNYARKPNWIIACELFATGSTSAWDICKRANIDPESTKIMRASTGKDTDKEAK